MTDPHAWLQTAGTELDRKLGLEVLEASPDQVIGRVPVAGNTQPFGLLNGGVSAYLAETLASIAAMLHVGPGGSAAGVDLNATHHTAVRSGWVTGVARPLRVGRSLASFEVVISDDDGQRVCTARLTVFLKRAQDA